MLISKIIEENIDFLELHQTQGPAPTGSPMGFDGLDYPTGGLHGGDLVTICGVPGIDARSLAYQIARNYAVDSGLKVGILNLSMTNHAAVLRMLCAEARVPMTRTKFGIIDKDSWTNLCHAASILTESKINFVSNLAEAFNPDFDLWIIDCIQRIEMIEYNYSIVNKIKNEALECDIPIIVLSYLDSGKVEKRRDKRPKLSDFKYGYGNLAELSDIVISVYRDDYYTPNENPGIAEIDILKNRYGYRKKTELLYIEEYRRYEKL